MARIEHAIYKNKRGTFDQNSQFNIPIQDF